MKRKILLLLVMASLITAAHAQKKQSKNVTGYAITAQQKGGKSWKEVRLVDINTGEELKSIYQSTQELQALNARTGKPVVKKTNSSTAEKTAVGEKQVISVIKVKKSVNLDMELDKAHGTAQREITALRTNTNVNSNINTDINSNTGTNTNRIYYVRTKGTEIATDKPFATNSAAMAYDKKHERLYYTPMGINQLRYIDLNSKTQGVYYFEDEPFGKVAGLHDAANQITRMVIASDGNGYALSNDARHLIRFSTGKKPEIVDLGTLTDDAANGTNSVHKSNGYGGDMIADASKNLYLITANRNVFLISLESRVATFKGTIKGLPKGFSTNGAMVEEGSKVIVASSESTVGYYRFDLNTLEAEKVSSDATVYNASDLANGVLAFDKKKKNKKVRPEVKPEEEQAKDVAQEEAARPTAAENALTRNNITLYPNAVTNGQVKLSFADQPAGKYQVQLIDMQGRIIRTTEVNIQNKVQIVDYRLPEVAKGSYLVKILSEPNNVSVTNKLVVQ